MQMSFLCPTSQLPGLTSPFPSSFLSRSEGSGKEILQLETGIPTCRRRYYEIL
jgi:hypothetical protein